MQQPNQQIHFALFAARAFFFGAVDDFVVAFRIAKQPFEGIAKIDLFGFLWGVCGDFELRVVVALLLPIFSGRESRRIVLGNQKICHSTVLLSGIDWSPT